jgi:DNA topoisomerase-1
LSAGRVQSAVVKLLYNKEKDINSFKSNNYSSITCSFIINKKEKINNIPLSKNSVEGEVEDEGVKFTKEKALQFIQESLDYYNIKSVEVDTSKTNPPPPYTTSSLQQDAFNKIGFSIKKTMDVAQKLYESGKITYMRTDSTLLSNMILGNIKTFVEVNYGENYYKFMQYQTKSKNAQEAHEAIRPTNIGLLEIVSEKNDVTDQNKLYKLIWQRTVASQMKPALYRILKLSLTNDDCHYFNGQMSRCYFEGFKIIYGENIEEDNDFKTLLEKLGNLKRLKVAKMESNEIWTTPPNRYNESSLVKKLESSGIGRPSTYANIISTIIEREYVERKNIEGVEHEITNYSWKPDNDINEITKKVSFGAEKNKLVISEIGKIVTEYLENNFSLIMDLDFTVNMENDLDLIADGTTPWLSVMNKFYGPFNTKINSLMNKPEVEVEVTDVERFENNLGKDPQTGLDVVVKKGKFGPMIELGKLNDKNHGYFNLKSFLMSNKKKMEEITLKDALEIMKFPKILGKIDKNEVSIMMGKFGLYLKYNNKNFSLPKKYDANNLTLDEAKIIIEESKDNNDKGINPTPKKNFYNKK